MVAALALSTAATRAHEVLPAIADVEVGPDRLDMSVELTLEALVAGIDLRGLVDTDASERSNRYDRLRGLDPIAMEAAFRRFWPQMREALAIEIDGDRATARLDGVEIPPVGNAELPRKTILHLSAELPGEGPVAVGWAPSYGSLVVREQTGDPDDPGYTGFLTDGALSAPIPRRGGGLFGLFGR